MVYKALYHCLKDLGASLVENCARGHAYPCRLESNWEKTWFRLYLPGQLQCSWDRAIIQLTAGGQCLSYMKVSATLGLLLCLQRSHGEIWLLTFSGWWIPWRTWWKLQIVPCKNAKVTHAQDSAYKPRSLHPKWYPISSWRGYFPLDEAFTFPRNRLLQCHACTE